MTSASAIRARTPSSARAAAGGSKTYNLSWVGNDGTFSSRRLDRAAEERAGHADRHDQPGDSRRALGDSEPGRPEQRGHRVPDDERGRRGRRSSPPPTTTPSRRPARSDRASHSSYFFDVPAGTPAFKVDLSGAERHAGHRRRSASCAGTRRASASTPTRVSNCYTPGAGGCCTGSADQPHDDQPAGRRLGSDRRRAPQLGRGQRAVHADRLDPGRQRLAEPGRDRLGDDRRADCALLHADQPVRRVHRACRRDDARQRASAPRRRSPTSRSSSTRSSSRPGSTSLRATIGSPSDPAADLDLFVFNCTTGTCVLAGQSADGDSEESVTIANPAAGIWVVLVDGFAVPAGTTTYNYVDVFVNAGVRLGQRHRRERAAAGRRVVDGARQVTANAARQPAACCSATSRSAPTPTSWSARAM